VAAFLVYPDLENHLLKQSITQAKRLYFLTLFIHLNFQMNKLGKSKRRRKFGFHNFILFSTKN